MLYAKVKITKNRTGLRTDFKYPDGYDAEKVSPVIYQNEGKNIEFCIALVADDYKFSKDIEEINKTEAETLIDAWIDVDKDIKPEIDRAEIKAKKKAHL